MWALSVSARKSCQLFCVKALLSTCPCVGYFYDLAGSKMPLLYDVQELYRWAVSFAIIRLLEDHKLKKSDFIVTEITTHGFEKQPLVC